MEKAIGKVVNTNGTEAQVAVMRGSMCGDSCSNCGMCENKGTKITAQNNVGAKKGDSVRLCVSTSKGLAAAALVYMVPVLVLIVAVLLFLNAGFEEGKAVIYSFLIMLLWFVGVFIAEKKGAFKEKIYAQITEILNESVD